MPVAAPPKPKSNREFNRTLCESKSPLAVREFFAADPKTVRKLSVAEATNARRRMAISEAASAAVGDLYEAKVAHVDKKNLNDRIYPKAVMQANIDRLAPMLAGGALIGTSGHPGEEEYAGDPSQIAVKWHELRIEPDNSMMGTFGVIPTDKGKDLQVILDEKLSALGFSTYGFGLGADPTESERAKYGLADDEECVVMQQGFELSQLDPVRGPSVFDAAVTSYPDNGAGTAVKENAQAHAEACSSGLHWREIGRCGHMVSECKCEADDKHCVYSDKDCPKCANAVGEGMSKEEFKAAIKESKQKKPAVAEGREPLAKTYTQYIQGKNSFEPAGPIKLTPELSKDAFNIIPTWSGVRFERRIVQCDQAYRFEGSPADLVLQEIDAFWKKKEDYKKFGIMHRRGVIVHGPPGTGKSIGIAQAVEMVTAAGDVAFYGENIRALKEALEAFRDVEPDRKVLVILEDADRFIGYQESAAINLLDGADSVEGILYIASTNYLSRFPERLIRSRRFDRKVFVGPPNLAGRKTYLQHKLGKTVSAEELDRLAKEADGLSYGDLATFITDAFILDEDADAVLKRLKSGVRTQGARLEEQIAMNMATVAESNQSSGPRRVAESQGAKTMKTAQELEADVARITAENTALASSNKALTDAINPVVKGLTGINGIQFPERQVLPAEVAERQKTLDARIVALEAEKTTAAAEKTALQTQITDLQNKLAAKEKAGKVWAKARPILADNSYSDPLKEELREKIAADASFDESKVEAFLDGLCTKFDRISGQTAKGKKAEGAAAQKPAKPEGQPAGVQITDEEIDGLEDALAEAADDLPEGSRIGASSVLAAAFGGPARG